jgi:hypothetical protein
MSNLQQQYTDLIFNSGKTVYQLTATSQNPEANYARINKWLNQLPKSIESLETDLELLGKRLMIVDLNDDTDIINDLSVVLRSYNELYQVRSHFSKCFLRASMIVSKLDMQSGKCHSLRQVKLALMVTITYWER